MENIEKNDFFFTITVTVICIWLFFSPERSRNDQKFYWNCQGTVTNKKVTERERYRNERITVNK